MARSAGPRSFPTKAARAPAQVVGAGSLGNLTNRKNALVNGECDVIRLGCLQLAQPVEPLAEIADAAQEHRADPVVVIPVELLSGAMRAHVLI